MTLADTLAVLAFEAALDGDLEAWRVLGAAADLLDRRRRRARPHWHRSLHHGAQPAVSVD
jgi:hypothetical protein